MEIIFTNFQSNEIIKKFCNNLKIDRTFNHKTLNIRFSNQDSRLDQISSSLSWELAPKSHVIIQMVNKTIPRPPVSALICIPLVSPSLLSLDFPFFPPLLLPLLLLLRVYARLYDASSALNEVRPRPLLINSRAGRWSNVFKLLAQFIEQTSLFSATEPHGNLSHMVGRPAC